VHGANWAGVMGWSGDTGGKTAGAGSKVLDSSRGRAMLHP
jgi:hypothetical protein